MQSTPLDATVARRPRWAVVVGATVGVAALLYIGLWVAAGDGIARGTTVLGVDVGGRSPSAARDLLARELRDASRAPVDVRAGDVRASVTPRRAGLSLDVGATVDAARTRSWNPVALVHALFGGEKVDPVVAVDEAALADEVDRLAGKVDQPAREGGVTFEGTDVQRILPRQGRELRQARAADALRESYLHDSGVVRLPTAVQQPKVTEAEVRRAVRELARPAVAEPVTLDVDGRAITIEPRTLARALSLRPDDQGRLELVVDGERLHQSLAPDLADIETPARDASYRIVNGKPRVVPARQGEGVDPDELAAAVVPALTGTGSERTAAVSIGVAEPAVTTEQAQGLGVTELVAEYTTFYPSDFPPRLTNIHRAADLMDSTLVLPGDVFSLNDTVGERTAERGFAAGFIIDNGQLAVDFGGGVSQLATTTFNAAYFAGLEIIEHHPHSFYISRYPEGRESTVAWGVKDVRFRNDSDTGVFITTGYTNSSVTVRIWGTKRYRIESTKSARYAVKPFRVINDPRPEGTQKGDCVATEGVPGFKVDVYRLFFQNGQRVDREKFHTVYAPENEVRCGSPSPTS